VLIGGKGSVSQHRCFRQFGRYQSIGPDGDHLPHPGVNLGHTPSPRRLWALCLSIWGRARAPEHGVASFHGRCTSRGDLRLQ
jgi:hypothetical protein